MALESYTIGSRHQDELQKLKSRLNPGADPEAVREVLRDLIDELSQCERIKMTRYGNRTD